MRVILSLLLLGAAACAADGGTDDADDGRPDVVVTTTILGDVVREVAGGAVDVAVVMPAGADPHDFAPSARQAEAIAAADLVVANGAGFEQGLADVLDAAADGGAPTFTFADHVELRELDGGEDPHLWLDPTNVAAAVPALAEAISGLEGVDAEVVEAAADAYLGELADLDLAVEALVTAVPEDRRVLVTNHEVLGYFADRYGFEVLGAVVPSLTTSAEPSAADVDELAALIRAEAVPAIFAETTAPTALAEALARAVGSDVEVVELFSESLGEPGSGADTYLGLVRTDAERIVEALSA